MNTSVWFKTNVLSLNPDKINFMHSITKNNSVLKVNVLCNTNVKLKYNKIHYLKLINKFISTVIIMP